MVKQEIYLYSQETVKRNEVIKFLMEHKGFSLGAAHIIADGFEAGVDIDIFNDKDWEYNKIRIIMQGLLMGVDLTKLFPENTDADVLRLALELIKDNKEIPNDLTAERNKDEILIMRNCMKEGIPYACYLQNNVLIQHEELINRLLKENPERDINSEFAWVADYMDVDFVNLIWEAKSNGIFEECFMSYDCDRLRREMTNAYIEQNNALYNSETLSRFKMFQGFSKTEN